MFRAAPLGLLGLALGGAADPQQFPGPSDYPAGVRNTEKSTAVPLAPREALQQLAVPSGFMAMLFAAEPDVAQPISIAFDDRGRLWVAECYTFESAGGPWNKPAWDRILILEDADGDGRFDRRKVFASGVRNLTSVLPGFGGVWACTTPSFVFIPDRDGDDVPDGAPEILLDGWNDGGIGHCVFNGLTWGPDGWIYGTQGIQGESNVGRPGGPERRRFNGGVWRFHPTKRIFEVVAEGTTNPWGLDFDDHGQGFFTNCVIGHLWHLIPGAHYERMYGSDYTPNTYALVKCISDHVHYAGAWNDSKDGSEKDKLGGGHAHAGAMVYLGDNWPPEFRNTVFMNNIHGRRLNNDSLERRGSGYLGRHRPDFLRSGDPGFRGLAAKYGPDGGVYVSDWSDVGECHEKTGVHRTSGRIYKIVHGTPNPPGGLDVARMPDAELVALQLHKNDWYVRHARRVLQERAEAGKDMKAAHAGLREILSKNPDQTRKLRALWALHATGGLDGKSLLALHDHPGEHVRGWAVRLAGEGRDPSDATLAKWASMAAKDPSPSVRLSIASTLQRVPLPRRGDVAKALVGRSEDANDPNLPLLIWYAIEPVVAADPARAADLLRIAGAPFLRQSITRRMAGGRGREDDDDDK
jgi:putative membrane-bound dehydrogenase-like protein